MEKRYLIVYKDKEANLKKASSLIGNSIVEFKTNTQLNEAGAYHFPQFGITSAILDDKTAETLKSNAEIDFIEEDIKVGTLGRLTEVKGGTAGKAAKGSNNDWNMKMINAPQAWKKGYNGKGVSIAILDTGIATHPDLRIMGGISMVPGIASYNDDDGHGTHCAGIAAGRGVDKVFGVAPEASLYAVKVLKKDPDGKSRGDTTWIIAGMAWCVENEMDVASMSLGGSSDPSEAYAVAVKACQNAGVTVVCASGNSYETIFPYVNAPANSIYPGLAIASPIAVGSVDSNEVIAASSSRGAKPGVPWNQVGVVAPGVAIYSTYLNNGYATMSGTSMACPHVSGLAALLRQKDPEIDAMQVKATIFSTAKELGGGPGTPAYGFGLIDCQKALA